MLDGPKELRGKGGRHGGREVALVAVDEKVTDDERADRIVAEPVNGRDELDPRLLRRRPLEILIWGGRGDRPCRRARLQEPFAGKALQGVAVNVRRLTDEDHPVRALLQLLEDVNESGTPGFPLVIPIHRIAILVRDLVAP